MSSEPESQRRRVRLPARGLSLNVVDWGGSGPPALLAHATGFCTDTLGVIAARLRTRFRVIGYDARGHGESDKPTPPEPYEWIEFALDLSAVAAHLLGELGETSFALAVGHSFGGTCLMNATGREPGRFQQIALLDPVIVPPPADFPNADPMARGPNVAAEIARKRTHVFPSREALRQRWKEKGTFGDWDPRALELYLAHGFHDRPDGQIELACPGAVEASVYESGRRFDAWKAAEALTRRTLLLHAGRGNFPRAVAERLASLSAQIELRSLDEQHLMAMTAPDLVSDQILGWAK
ncbi:MAG TPA: alpha/beta hydrolase [Myxococcota bacterium]|nr:alpha/beta hydrolase [Myxococcota bacterium]